MEVKTLAVIERGKTTDLRVRLTRFEGKEPFVDVRLFVDANRERSFS